MGRGRCELRGLLGVIGCGGGLRRMGKVPDTEGGWRGRMAERAGQSRVEKNGDMSGASAPEGLGSGKGGAHVGCGSSRVTMAQRIARTMVRRRGRSKTIEIMLG